PEFPAAGGVDLGGRDVRLGNTAGGHSAFPARSTGSEHELGAFPGRRGERIACGLVHCTRSLMALSGHTEASVRMPPRETVSLHAFLRSMGSRSMRPRANPPRPERPLRSWYDPPSRA